MPFQINSSKLFLTYPQCDRLKEDLLNFLIIKFNPVKYLVAHELHANGDHHLHAYLELSGPFRTRDPRFADFDGAHGNYQGCRNGKNVLKYCTKSDDFCGNVDVSSELEGNTRQADFAKLVSGEITLVELVQKRPSYLSGLTRLENDLRTFKRLKTPPKPDLPTYLPNPWGKLLRTNINDKKRHFWIYSTRPNLGKTFRFILPLKREYNSLLKTDNEPYWPATGGEKLVLLDEYNTALFKYSQLNSFCDGTYGYRVFQGGVIHLHSPIVIVCSNHSIIDLYPNMYELLYARFNEIKLD